MITLQSRVESYKLTLPSNPAEIPAQYYEGVTECINLAEHYAIIALVRQTTLSYFLMTLQNPKAKVQASDVAILCKVNSPNVSSDFKVGQQIIIDESSVARGNQIIAPSALSYENVVSYFLREEMAIKQSKDEEIRKLKSLTTQIIQGLAKDENGRPIKEYPICFISFKIVPLSDIHGTVDSQISFKDPFVEVIETKQAEAKEQTKEEVKE